MTPTKDSLSGKPEISDCGGGNNRGDHITVKAYKDFAEIPPNSSSQSGFSGEPNRRSVPIPQKLFAGPVDLQRGSTSVSWSRGSADHRRILQQPHYIKLLDGDGSSSNAKGLLELPHVNESVESSKKDTARVKRGTYSLQVPPPVPPCQLTDPDNRTLFLTFSNGHPLTVHEIFEFFMTHYNADVESIFLERSNVPRPPKYANITFFHEETAQRVLGRERKVKFKLNGRDMWARRFTARWRRDQNRN